MIEDEELNKLLNNKIFSIIRLNFNNGHEEAVIQFNTFYCRFYETVGVYSLGVYFSDRSKNFNEQIIGSVIKSISSSKKPCGAHYTNNFIFYYGDVFCFKFMICSNDISKIKLDIFDGFYEKQPNDHVFVEHVLA